MTSSSSETLTSTLPARLDALPWSRWHWRVVAALGVTWMLDGLEVTVVGSLGPALQDPDTLGLSAGEIGWAGSAYVAGAVLGALFFGRLADRLGRKPLFLVTLSVYLVGTLLTAATFDFESFVFCRFLTGFGIGGEYAAINSAIDELIPARVRGLVDLAINGSFWIGAAAGAALSIVLLEPGRFGPDVGWRVAFALGAVLAIAILLVRRYLPESPRWLMTRGRLAEAERVVADIEAEVAREHGPCPECKDALAIKVRPHLSWREILRLLLTRYRRRTTARLRADGCAGVLLQRHFLHLCARAHELLRCRCRRRWLLHISIRRRQFPGTADPRPAVRFGRKARADRGHLRDRGARAARVRIRVRRRVGSMRAPRRYAGR